VLASPGALPPLREEQVPEEDSGTELPTAPHLQAAEGKVIKILKVSCLRKTWKLAKDIIWNSFMKCQSPSGNLWIPQMFLPL
jgi:hypothetical protein